MIIRLGSFSMFIILEVVNGLKKHQFVERSGRIPQQGEYNDIFEQLYAVRLNRPGPPVLQNYVMFS